MHDLAAKVEHERRADAAFFRRRPDRTCRIRRAFHNELVEHELQLIEQGAHLPPAKLPGEADFVGVHRPASIGEAGETVRTRVFFRAPATMETDLTESEALALFWQHVDAPGRVAFLETKVITA